MTYFGFVLKRISGSHHFYQPPDIDEVMNVQPKKDGLAKPYQVRQFLRLLETNQLDLEDETEDETNDE